MQTDNIRQTLFSLADESYKQFHQKLIPTVDPKNIVGVRTPELRRFAKQIIKENKVDAFLSALPHVYYDENQLHAFILSELKDFDRTVREVCRFLPYVDNWATCDQLSPKVFNRHKPELIPYIQQWMHSNHIYTVRFGIGRLMLHFLDDDFDIQYPEWVASIRSDEYYINMMIAWYFATALAKQYNLVIHYITDKKLDTWTHNKTIQKAIESYRITDEQKAFLKKYKRHAPTGASHS